MHLSVILSLVDIGSGPGVGIDYFERNHSQLFIDFLGSPMIIYLLFCGANDYLIINDYFVIFWGGNRENIVKIVKISRKYRENREKS